MTELLLSKKKNVRVLVDDEDYDRIKDHKWYYLTDGYVVCNNYFGKKVYLHRIIMNAKADEFVDHKNHDPLDCRKSELRICTRQQNNRNRKIEKGIPRSSIYKGVSKSNTDKWSAGITINYQHHIIGYFPTERDAALAYDRAAEKHFGEFAKLNFPEETTNPTIYFGAIKPHPSTGLFGVYLTKKNKFRAMTPKGQIGTFDTPVEAAMAYDYTAKKLFGDSVLLNNISLF